MARLIKPGLAPADFRIWDRRPFVDGMGLTDFDFGTSSSDAVRLQEIDLTAAIRSVIPLTFNPLPNLGGQARKQ